MAPPQKVTDIITGLHRSAILRTACWALQGPVFAFSELGPRSRNCVAIWKVWLQKWLRWAHADVIRWSGAQLESARIS
jgi:hypothetical protein